MKSDLRNSLAESINLLDGALRLSGDQLIGGSPQKAAIKLMSLRILQLAIVMLRDSENMTLYPFALLERGVIESAADSCLIACGRSGDTNARAFLMFDDRAKERLERFIKNQTYTPAAKDEQDWCKHSKLSRVAALQKNHGTVEGHDFRNNYDYLSLYVHTSPHLLSVGEGEAMLNLQTLIVNYCCHVQREHILRVLAQATTEA